MARINELMIVQILKTSNILDVTLTEILKEMNITHLQYNILRILKGSFPKPLNPGDIKSRMIFPNPDVTRIIDRMVEKKIVIRNVCPANKRKMDILITDAGIEVLEIAKKEINKSLSNFFKTQISKEEAQKTIDILKIIEENLSKKCPNS